MPRRSYCSRRQQAFELLEKHLQRRNAAAHFHAQQRTFPGVAYEFRLHCTIAIGRDLSSDTRLFEAGRKQLDRLRQYRAEPLGDGRAQLGHLEAEAADEAVIFGLFLAGEVRNEIGVVVEDALPGRDC